MNGFWKRVLCLLLMAVCLLGAVPVSRAAVPDHPQGLYLTQEGSGTCTLCSAAMMVRSCLYLNGNEAWSTVTQEALRTSAWLNGVGLKWNFKYTAESCVVNVGYQGLKGISPADLKAVLDKHPEGIVLYCAGVPHAVFLMGYEGDVFYCAETVRGYSGQAIPLAESWMGETFGSQEALLEQVTAYWYVSSYEAQAVESCRCQASYAGLYRVTTENEVLLIRAGHGKTYSVAGRIPAGAEVTVTKASGETGDDWAHVTYNGITGYASMEYLKKIGELPDSPETVWGTVTGNDLRIRSGAGTAYEILGYLMKGDRVEILEQKTVGAMTWGRIEAGWISLTYVDLDEPVTEPEPPVTEPPTTEPPTTEPPTTEPPTTEPPTTEPPTTEPPTTEPKPETLWGTVTGNDLRIRSGAGTAYEILGYLMKGDRVEILEQKTVGAMTWGRTEAGWISLTYVDLDEPVTEPEPPATEPPTTEPPTTEPPTTEPPTTEPPTTEPKPETLWGTVTVNDLRIRSGAGMSHRILGYLMKGDRVELLEQKQVNGMTWGRIEAGWISLDYVELDPRQDQPAQTRMVTVNTDCLRIRGGAGLNHTIVGFLYRGAKVEVLEQTTVDGMIWGRTEDGWISMDYVI